MNWQPLEEAAVSAAAIIITTCIPYAVALIRSHIKNATAANAIADAVTIGAGIAHDALVTAIAKGGTPDWVAAKELAITKGVAAAQRVCADVTPDQVRAALSSLTASDPTVPAGSGTVATAVAQPGQGVALAEAK